MKSITTKRLTLCALFTALIAVCAQITIPLPLVPITLALFAVHLTGALLGPKLGALSCAVYALLGACGLPVFANFMGGPAVLFGKTGGYVLGYILCAFIVGWSARRFGSYLQLCVGMAVGVVVCYTFGTAWFMVITGLPLSAALSYCVLPFLPGDVIKIALAALLAKKLRPVIKMEEGRTTKYKGGTENKI